MQLLVLIFQYLTFSAFLFLQPTAAAAAFPEEPSLSSATRRGMDAGSRVLRARGLRDRGGLERAPRSEVLPFV